MKKRKWLALLTVICCFAVLWRPVSAEVVSPNDMFYVYDGAKVLSGETERYIIDSSRELDQKTGAQIVVVTIPSLDGQSLEEYATELFRSWGIGDAKKNNGLLLLCVVNDRQFRVEVGYGLEGDLPDGKTGRMQDTYIIPLLREDQFDAGIKNGYSAFLQEIADVYDVSISGDVAVAYEEEELNPAFGICLAISFALSLFGSIFLLKKKKKQFTAAFWIGEGLQVLVMALVLQSLFTAIWIVGVTLAFSLGVFPGRRRYRNFHGGFGSGGHFGGFGGGGFSGGGFGGGGRSGGGGSSRGF